MTLAATTGICIEFDPRGVGELGYHDTLLVMKDLLSRRGLGESDNLLPEALGG